MNRIPHYNLHSTLYPLEDDYDMQAIYPTKLPKPHWDRVHVEYPTRRSIGTGISSETLARRWIPPGEVWKQQDLYENHLRGIFRLRALKTLFKHWQLRGLLPGSKALVYKDRFTFEKKPLEEMKDYFRDYNITAQLTRSQTIEDFGRKQPDTKRFNKHTACTENEFVYPQSRRIAERVPQLTAHGTTEMKSRYTPPVKPSRLIINKDQYKHPATIPQNPLPQEHSWHKDLEPLDTTYEGFEKHLDPYLTTSRLHHRPYTADQLQRLSCNKDIVTYYTFKDMVYTRTPKPVTECRLPVSRPKSVYDREQFKQGHREIITHNKLQHVPGTFRTEVRDNFIPPILQSASQIHNLEEEVRSYYEKRLANLETNLPEEYVAFQKQYSTENSTVGSRKPIYAVFNQFPEKNKRLARKSIFQGSLISGNSL